MREKEDKVKQEQAAARANKKEEERKKAEAQAKSEAAFNEWKKAASKRPKPVPNSFAYVGGKLTGYYDSASCPAPSFVNPVAWQPIHVPKPTSKPKPKPTTKLRPKTAPPTQSRNRARATMSNIGNAQSFNPMKYL